MLLEAAAITAAAAVAVRRAGISIEVMVTDARRLQEARCLEPTESQLNAIRTALRKNDVLCFGDSDHADIRIKAFFFHPAVQQVFKEEGVTDFCFEQSPSLNTKWQQSTAATARDF